MVFSELRWRRRGFIEMYCLQSRKTKHYWIPVETADWPAITLEHYIIIHIGSPSLSTLQNIISVDFCQVQVAVVLFT